MSDKKNNRLEEIVLIRLILIVLLVLYHSFCMYSGAWPALEGMQEINAYWWISKTSYSFMLESFVLISGYLFVFQIDKGKINGIENLVLAKLKRLIFPSIVFSIVYVILLKKTSVSLILMYEIINGVAHMWFLPMLFWCFIITYFIRNVKIKEEYKLILLFLFTFVSFPLPFRLGSSFFYMFFFYLGGYLWSNREKLITKATFKKIFFVFVLYIVVFIIAWIQPNKIVAHCMRPFYSSFGCVFIYLFSLKIVNCRQLSSIMSSLSSMCFGIYLFQQFILMAIYKHTQLPYVVGFQLLPWIGFLIALFMSMSLTYVIRLSKVGRYLIG